MFVNNLINVIYGNVFAVIFTLNQCSRYVNKTYVLYLYVLYVIFYFFLNQACVVKGPTMNVLRHFSIKTLKSEVVLLNQMLKGLTWGFSSRSSQTFRHLKL